MPTFFDHALLSRARLDLGLTQEEAAAAAGVDVRTYRRYESGEVNDPTQGFAVRHPSRRRILRRLARELGIAEEDLIVTRADASPVIDDAPSPPERAASAPVDEITRPTGFFVHHVHALPRAQHFVGRVAILKRLHAWHAGESGGVVAIVALGGQGKTSIVERFVTELGDGPHRGGVLVYSFYDDPRIEAFFDHALAYLAPGVATQPGERLDVLVAALRGGPHLLVLDGLEIVQGTGAPGSTFGRIEDAALRRLFTGIARGIGGARLLCTTRFALTDLAAWEGSGLLTVDLGALSADEGVELLGRWGIAGDGAALSPLIDRVGGHALSVAMMGSYAGAFLGGDAARAGAIDLEPAARDDAAARRLLSVLRAYAGALPDAARDLVARLSLFPSGATLDVLEAIAQAGGIVGGATNGLDRDGLRRSLVRLERLGLIFAARGADRWAAHPFVAQYFQSILGVPAARIHAVTRDVLAARLDVHRVGATEGTLLDAYEELLVHTRAAGRAVDAWIIYQRPMGGFGNLGLQLGEMRRGARILQGFAEDGDPARIRADMPGDVRARIAYDLGLFAGALGDLDRAVRCYRVHNEIVREAGHLPGLGTGLRTLAYTERLRGALADALALATAAVNVSDGAGSRADVVRSLALRASVLHDLGRVDEAAAGFAEVRAMGDDPFARRGLWEAEHLLEIGQIEAARTLTARNVEVCRELGWEGHAAHGETVLALACLAVDPPDLDAARAHLVSARRWTAATGEVEVVLRCLDVAARVALAEARIDEARAVIAEGREIAEGSGFGLFALRFAKLLESARASSVLG
ncbi:WD-40 repeat protein [Minicystis rosea]|nr:WD-40 repeat protein [Minicystis rosea]